MEDGLDEVSPGSWMYYLYKPVHKGGGRFAGLEKMLDEKVDIPAACSIELPKEISDTTEVELEDMAHIFEGMILGPSPKTFIWEI